MNVSVASKLPDVGTTIFTRMSALAAGCNAINLSQGYPDFAPPAALVEALGRAAQGGHNQYPPMAGLADLRQLLAEQLTRHRQVQACPETEITIVPGATESLFCCVMAVVRPGDEVILLDPCYDSYAPAVRLAGGTPVHVALRPRDFSVDWNRVEAAITPRSRMIMINSPHNPTGSTLSKQDLDTLEEIVERHDLLVSSDEVYEYLVFDGRQHHSVLQWPALRERAFAHFSFGKTYSVTGWKTGYCVAAPKLTAELRKVHQFVAFVAVTPVQRAIAEFIAAEPDYPLSLAAFYQRKRDLFLSALENSRFQARPSAGTYFQLLDYSAISHQADQSLSEHWTQSVGVASIPISVFYHQAPQQQVLRFCFAKSDQTLLRAAELLCKI